ncbi:MAG: hypothetical protein U1F48_13785 [Burkholderiales bacterium]
MNVAKSSRLSRLLAAAVAGLCFASATTAAEINPWDGEWRYDLAIYGWLPSVNGTINFDLPRGISPDASARVDPSSYLSSLQFAAMALGQARKGDFALFTDVVYVDFADLKSRVREVSLPGGRVTLPLDEDVNFGLRALVWTAGGSWTVARGSWGNLDLGGGVRYAGIRTSLDWNYSGPNGVLGRSGGVSENINFWDGVAVAYGSVSLDSDRRWFLPYYVDIGAGNHSNWTTMEYAGLGYRFDWGSVILVYKNLYYNASSGQTVENVTMGGPAIGVNFRW